MIPHKHAVRLLLVAGLSISVLQGCAVVAVGAAAVGVSSATDPRTLGTQLDDQAIEMKTNAKLGNDKQLENYRIRAISYGKQVLLVGTGRYRSATRARCRGDCGYQWCRAHI